MATVTEIGSLISRCPEIRGGRRFSKDSTGADLTCEPDRDLVDEDAMDSDLVAALRSRGITVITALDDSRSENNCTASCIYALPLRLCGNQIEFLGNWA